MKLDEDLRGKQERFEMAPSMKKRGSNGPNKERIQHTQKYSQYVNEINRKSFSRGPTKGSPRGGRFDAEAYKKQF